MNRVAKSAANIKEAEANLKVAEAKVAAAEAKAAAAEANAALIRAQAAAGGAGGGAKPVACTCTETRCNFKKCVPPPGKVCKRSHGPHEDTCPKAMKSGGATGGAGGATRCSCTEKPCKFNLDGKCTKGADCGFKHKNHDVTCPKAK